MINQNQTGSQNPSTRYRDHLSLNFANQGINQSVHPSSTKNQTTVRSMAIKKQLATNNRQSEPNQNFNPVNQIPIQTIQNITNYHIDMPQQIILNDDGRNYERIMGDNNSQDNRSKYVMDRNSLGPQNRIKSPKDSNVAEQQVSLQPINNPVSSKAKKNKITLKKINSNEGNINGNIVSSEVLPKGTN